MTLGEGASGLATVKVDGAGDADCALSGDVGHFGIIFGGGIFGRAGDKIRNSQLGWFHLQGHDQAATIAFGSSVGQAPKPPPDQNIPIGDDGATGVEVAQDDDAAVVFDVGSGAQGGLQVQWFGQGLGDGGVGLNELGDRGLLFDGVSRSGSGNGSLAATGVNPSEPELVVGQGIADFLQLPPIQQAIAGDEVDGGFGLPKAFAGV